MRTFLSFGQTVGILRLFRVRLANVSATYAESIINDFANELMPKYNDLMDGIFKDKQTQTETRRISLESQLEQETDPAKISELKTKINTEKNLSASYGRILSSQRLHIRPVDIRSFIPSEVIDYLDSLIDSAGPDQEGEVQAKIKETLSGLFRALWSDWDTISTYIEAHPDDGKNKIKNVLNEAAQLIYTKPEPKTQEDVYSTSISEIRSILGNIRKNYYSLFDESSIILQFIEAMLKGGICSNIINTSEEGIKNIEALHDGLLGSIIGELNAKRFLLKSSDARQELVSKIRTAFFEVLRSASSFENINNLLSYLRQVVKNTVKKGMEETGVEYKRVYRNDYDAYSDLMHKKLMHEKNKGGKLSKKEESRLRAAEKEILKNFRQKYLKEYRSTFENAQEAEAAAEAAAQEHLNNIKIEKRSRVTLRGESLEDLTSDSGDAEINPFQPTEGLSDIIYGTPGSLKPSSVKDDPVFLQIMRKHYEDMKGAAVNADPSVPKIIKEAMWDLIIKENAASFKTQPGAIKSLIPNLKKMVQRHPSFNHLSKQESDDVDKYFRSTGGKTVGNKISQLLTNMSDSVSNQMRQSLTSEELKILEEEWAGADQADLLKSRFLQRGNYLDRVVDDTIKKGLKEEENVQGTYDKVKLLKEYNLLTLLGNYRRNSTVESKRINEIRSILKNQFGMGNPPELSNYDLRNPIIKLISYPGKQSVSLKDITLWTEWVSWIKYMLESGSIPKGISVDSLESLRDKCISNLRSAGLANSYIFPIKPFPIISGDRYNEMLGALDKGSIKSSPILTIDKLKDVSARFTELSSKLKEYDRARSTVENIRKQRNSILDKKYAVEDYKKQLDKAKNPEDRKKLQDLIDQNKVTSAEEIELRSLGTRLQRNSNELQNFALTPKEKVDLVESAREIYGDIDAFKPILEGPRGDISEALLDSRKLREVPDYIKLISKLKAPSAATGMEESAKTPEEIARNWRDNAKGGYAEKDVGLFRASLNAQRPPGGTRYKGLTVEAINYILKNYTPGQVKTSSVQFWSSFNW